jgi:hypothetical protein
MRDDLDVPTARSQAETSGGVAGVRFRTDVEPTAGPESRLREIQSGLSGGILDIPSGSALPHLNFYDVATHDGPTHTYVSLWVPGDLADQARKLLEAADFVVS